MPDCIAGRARCVWTVPSTGSLTSLRLRRETIPPLSRSTAATAGLRDHQTLRVRVYALGLNFADLMAMLGLYSATPRGEFIPGLEFAGIVEEVLGGKTETGRTFQQGDKIYGVTRFGAYATVIDADARYCRKLPPGWNFVDGASFPVQALTAFYALKTLGALKTGHTVLVHSAAGGVGLQALEIISREPEAVAVGLVGNAEKANFLRQRFALHARWRFIVRGDPATLADRLRTTLRDILEPAEAARGLGFDLVLDSLGGEYLRSGLDLLRPCGRLVVFGGAAMLPLGTTSLWSLLKPMVFLRLVYNYLRTRRLDPLSDLVPRNKSVMGFNLIWLYDKVDELDRVFGELEALILPRPYVGAEFDFDDIPDACAHLASGKSVGKVVVRLLDA